MFNNSNRFHNTSKGNLGIILQKVTLHSELTHK
jgi:hypothetical protein